MTRDTTSAIPGAVSAPKPTDSVAVSSMGEEAGSPE